MTAAELRELAQECANAGIADAAIDPTGESEWEDFMIAALRLTNAAAILEGAHE